ncbi:sigma-54-dependent Fis family transcriptional regulator [Candidatus Marinamargulisbacteria bacterium SCGC AAA071-K20]|nr:sigma-54-dependent Fis family transcriptional regulator [Candidatus Marinamargulisbacteria bacterium SCGC AAA071-K20]
MSTVIYDSEHADESREFSLLLAITTILSSSFNLKETLTHIFDVLHHNVSLIKGTLSLYDAYSYDLKIEVSYGFSDEEIKSGLLEKWLVVSNKTLDTEQATIIPHVEEEVSIIGEHDPELLNDESFICIPIIIGDSKIGAISLDFQYKNDKNLFQNIKFFSIISLMIGQEIKLMQLLEKEKESLRKENIKLKVDLKEKYNIHNMIGRSAPMIDIYEHIMQVAHSNATVLLSGESGTGKELVAHAIHYNSNRAEQPFIKINCGAIPENLLESEFFGYEKGAFTDAQETKMGLIEAANGGTVFLDEIGELPILMQVKILRVLQDREFTRVGGIESFKADIRVVAATNKNLEEEISQKRFRKDLFYRLNVFPIILPPLRDRAMDVLLLAEHFLEKFSKENSKEINDISQSALKLLNDYDWPGNVRELENCMERATILCQRDTILPIHLPNHFQKNNERLMIPEGDDSIDSFTLLVENFEKEIISNALDSTHGNCSKAARTLGTTHRILSYRMRKLGLSKTDFRSSDK